MRRGRIVIITVFRGSLVILAWRWQRAFLEHKFHANFTLRATGWTKKLNLTDGVSRIFGIDKVSEGKFNGANKWFGGFRDFRVEDLESKDRFAYRASYREREPLVPNGASGAGLVRVGSEPVGGIEVENNVGFEVTVSPVDVLQVLRADYCDFQIERV